MTNTADHEKAAIRRIITEGAHAFSPIYGANSSAKLASPRRVSRHNGHLDFSGFEGRVVNSPGVNSPEKANTSYSPNPILLEALSTIEDPLSRRAIDLLNGISDGKPKGLDEVAKDMGISIVEARDLAIRGAETLSHKKTPDKT